MSLTLTSKHKGVTLIEFLIAMTLLVVMLLALVQLTSMVLGYSYTNARAIRMNYELQNAMTLMSNDIRRAGYWGNANSQYGTGTNSNPFMATATDITINGSCLLFSYDQDKSGSLSMSNNANINEHYGFRLNNGVLEGLTSDSHFSCTDTSSSWEELTDPNIVTVTNLTFTPTAVTNAVGATATQTIRQVTITLTGQLVSDATIRSSITTTVRIRNDLFTP